MTRVAMLVTSDLLHDNRVRREAETLAEAGYDVTVYSHVLPEGLSKLGWAGRPQLTAIPVPQPSWIRGGGHLRPAARVRRGAEMAAAVWRWGGSQTLWQAAHTGHADIYHAHDLDTLAAAAWLAKRDGARLVYDSHELYLEQMRTEEATRDPAPARHARLTALRALYARLERRHIGQADAVITVSQAIAEELARRYRIAIPTLVLNTPRYRDMSGGSEMLRRTLGLGADQRIVLLQGAVLPGRGLIELVRSMTLLPLTYHLVFLGFNLGDDQAAVRAEIARCGLEARTHLLDALPADRLLEATASADVGVMLLADLNLNHRFAMPNKLFEYMMAGLPFVATDLPEIRRVVERTGAGVLIPGITPQAIAGGIAAALADPAAAEAMRRAGLEAARTEFNWARQAERLLDLYRRLAQPGKGNVR